MCRSVKGDNLIALFHEDADVGLKVAGGRLKAMSYEDLLQRGMGREPAMTADNMFIEPERKTLSSFKKSGTFFSDPLLWGTEEAESLDSSFPGRDQRKYVQPGPDIAKREFLIYLKRFTSKRC